MNNITAIGLFKHPQFISYDHTDLYNLVEGNGSIEALLVLCELNQNENGQPIQRQNFYGVELAKKLRREGVTAPIVFTSFLTRKQVYDEKIERGIINTVGHGFLQLPFTQQQLEREVVKLQPLNDLEMYDIVHNYCSLGGIIKMLLHSLSGLQSSLNNSLHTSEEVREKIRTAIIQAHEVFRQRPDVVLAEFDLKFSSLTPQNLNDAIRFADNVGTELIELFAPEERSGTKMKAKGNWKLLLLDDEITEEHLFVQMLRERNVQVVCTSNANGAWQAIENDPLFSLIVSDYRLEETVDGVKVHQPVQGYQFLKEVSDERPGYLRLAALSSLPRRFLMESFKHYGLRVEIFSKKDYLENEATIHLLCDELTRLGNENEEAIVRTPRITSETWAYFEPFYRHHRNSISYVSNETYINQRAKEYCEGVKQGKYMFSLSGYTALNLDGEKAKPTNDKAFKQYIEKCVCRRVAIWYSQYDAAASLKEVHRVIQGKDYKGDFKSTTPRNQINYNLALALEDFPWNMTVEEKYWLMFDMDIKNIEKIEEQENHILKLISGNLKEWCASSGLENISSEREFEPFFKDDEERYGGNFKILKSFLHQLYLFLVGKDELIRDLQNQIINWQKQIQTSNLTGNAGKFTSYLEYLRRRLMFTRSFKRDAKVKVNTYEEFYTNIMTAALKSVPIHEQKYFPSNAVVFYNSIENYNDLESKDAWVNALLRFHSEEMQQWYGNEMVSFDEVKSFRKNKSSHFND